MNQRLLTVFVFALLVAGAASFLVYRLISNHIFTAAPSATATLVVADHDLQTGELIHAADVRRVAWSGPVPAQAILKIEDAVGRGVVTRIFSNEPLVSGRLAARGAGAGLAATIPVGMRAVALRVNDVVGLAGFVLPGMRVDVLVAGTAPGGDAIRGGTISRTVLQNLEVLSANQRIDRNAEGKPEDAQVVNLLVTPDQAEVLNLASGEAKVQLVMRNPLDTQEQVTHGSTSYALFGITPPSAAPQAFRTAMRLQVPTPAPRLISKVAKPEGVSVEVLAGPRERNRRSARTRGNGNLLRTERLASVLIALILGLSQGSGRAADGTGQASGPLPKTDPSELSVLVNKSVVLENANGVRRILIGNPDIAEALAVSGTEVVVNGKAPGETTLVLWETNGQRSLFDVHVLPGHLKVDTVREELARELQGQEVSLRLEGNSVFLRGTVNDLSAADRAVSIASTLGKVVDLLSVKVPPAEPQILLKVRFVNVDREASIELGANLLSTGAGNTIGGVSTQQFTPPTPDKIGQGYNTQFSFSDALNILLFRRDLNLGATISALQAKQLAEILAEPNVLTLSGKSASFLAGGEFPFPTLQGGGAGIGQVTIQFREFGVRIHFLPTVTPRGTIRLIVTPEVSSLDFANGLTVQGFTVPGLATRRVQTEVELASGQSFAIAGLLDNRLTETLSKIPGLGDIPLLGKIFQSKSESRSRSELLVLVTPELVDPIPAGAPSPDIPMPKGFIKGLPMTVPSNPVPHISTDNSRWRKDTLPSDTLRRMQSLVSAAPGTPPVQVTPVGPDLPGAVAPQSGMDTPKN